MVGTLLERELGHLKDKRILIVMDDGLVFFGKLIDFDSETLLLKEVFQASSKEINWKKIEATDVWGKGIQVKELDESEEKEDKVGYVEWIKVDLEKLYIRTDHIVRIWYEGELEEKKETPKKTDVYTKD